MLGMPGVEFPPKLLLHLQISPTTPSPSILKLWIFFLIRLQERSSALTTSFVARAIIGYETDEDYCTVAKTLYLNDY